jgi:hypothetical protein
MKIAMTMPLARLIQQADRCQRNQDEKNADHHSGKRRIRRWLSKSPVKRLDIFSGCKKPKICNKFVVSARKTQSLLPDP